MNQLRRNIIAFIFCSRWLQAPLYFGLVVTLGIYVYEFIHHLVLLIAGLSSFSSTQIMMGVLDLIDVVMIANLLIMVIIGGFEIFVTRLELSEHADNPEWLDAVNANTMKVKLAVALISISSVHLLKTFFDISKLTDSEVMWQVIIHMTLLVSAVAIAFVNYIYEKGHYPKTAKARVKQDQ